MDIHQDYLRYDGVVSNLIETTPFNAPEELRIATE